MTTDVLDEDGAEWLSWSEASALARNRSLWTLLATCHYAIVVVQTEDDDDVCHRLLGLLVS